MNETTVRLSAIDEERFGIKTARGTISLPEDVDCVLDFCHTNQVVLLIVRCLSSELSTVQYMEQQGFLLMDTLLYYTRSVLDVPFPDGANLPLVRPVRPGEDEQVSIIAAQSFQGYAGHYHADPRLDRTRSDEVYISWAVRSCRERAVADEVLVAEVDNQIVGFGALKRLNDETGDGRLYGVAPAFQGQGVYRALMLHSLEWCRAQGCSRMLYSTQIMNIAAQKVCIRLGFELSHAYYTLHKWFDHETA